MRQLRGKGLFWGVGVLVATVWACETARNPGGIQRDLIPPTISLTTAADTQPIANGLTFSVTAGDNLGLKDIRLTFSGGYVALTDTVFNTQVLTFSEGVTVKFPPTSGAGGLITIIGRATDGAGNFTEDTLVIFLSNVQALRVLLIAPATGAVASTGRNIPVEVTAAQISGVRKVGFVVAPPTATTNPTVPPNDSVSYSPAPYPDSVDYVDTLTVLATTGTFTITGFAEDSSGRRVTSNTVTVTVLSAANDVTPPSVTDSIGKRVEVTDSVQVHATDPSAISWIGFRVRLASDSAVLEFDTVAVGGNLTDVVRRFGLNLGAFITVYPTAILVDGYACDAAVARNCSFSTVGGIVGAALKADSATVVAGTTHALPAGGQIADAIFSANRRELYLTNQTLGRVDVFSLATGTFDPNGIITAGPIPWGIALWPKDTLGHYSNDTLVVADAGGTELSILNATTRQLLWRQGLPNVLIERYSIVNTNGFIRAVITVHDVSDRPQYLGTMCRVTGGGTACAPDSIYAVYSTTPTLSSSSPFNGRATLRMEKLINTTDTTLMFGHLFWEIGALGQNVSGDTLRIEMIRPSFGQRKVVLTACALVTIDFPSFGLGDQTFVRNTGNFTHGFIGEGGNIATPFARVFSYSAKKSLTTPANSCLMGGVVPESGTDDIDRGASPGVNVSDFISNTGVHVISIATNFNGLTNLVRTDGDSIYYLDEGLRLWGTSAIGHSTPGMDMNYNHNFQPGGTCSPICGGTGLLSNRMVFAASPDTTIRAFDTYFFNQQAAIPIRDPIIGPVRVSLDTAGTGQQYLFAITTRGLVVVSLPAITNNHTQSSPVPVAGTSSAAPRKPAPAPALAPAAPLAKPAKRRPVPRR
jgi:hypothetical protein